jgi:hypothetical protein
VHQAGLMPRPKTNGPAEATLFIRFQLVHRQWLGRLSSTMLLEREYDKVIPGSEPLVGVHADRPGTIGGIVMLKD